MMLVYFFILGSVVRDRRLNSFIFFFFIFLQKLRLYRMLKFYFDCLMLLLKNVKMDISFFNDALRVRQLP